MSKIKPKQDEKKKHSIEIREVIDFALNADLSIKKLDAKNIKVHIEKTKVLFGGLSLTLSVKIICMIEITIAIILLIQAFDLLIHNQRYFYLRFDYEPYRILFFGYEIFLLLGCIFSVVLTITAMSRNRPELVVPHAVWQILLVFTLGVLFLAIIILACFGKILVPSAVVLAFMVFIPGALESWWIKVFYEFYQQLSVNYRLNHMLRRDSQEPIRNVFSNGLLLFQNSDTRKYSMDYSNSNY